MRINNPSRTVRPSERKLTTTAPAVLEKGIASNGGIATPMTMHSAATMRENGAFVNRPIRGWMLLSVATKTGHITCYEHLLETGTRQAHDLRRLSLKGRPACPESRARAKGGEMQPPPQGRATMAAVTVRASA